MGLRDKRFVGSEGEELVARFLMGENINILARNYHTSDSEIDIIFEDEGYIVFGEVKMRSSYNYGIPEASVNLNKQKHICKASRVFLYSNHYPLDVLVRYDVFAISNGTVNWIKNAFEYCLRY